MMKPDEMVARIQEHSGGSSPSEDHLKGVIFALACDAELRQAFNAVVDELAQQADGKAE